MQHTPQLPSSASTSRSNAISQWQHRRTLRTTSVPVSPQQAVVLFADLYVQLLLLYLDVESVEAFVVFLGDRFGRVASWLFQDDVLWTRLLQLHFASTDDAFLSNALVAASSSFQGDRRLRNRAPLTLNKTHKSRFPDLHQDSRTSNAFHQFFTWSRERQWFDQRVVVIRGDSSSIDPASDTASPFDEVLSDIELRKRGVRARSGDFSCGFDSDPEREMSVHPLNRGSYSAFVIRGKNSHARSLIHLVSPRSFLQSPWKAFRRTFGNAMEAIVCEQLRNVAVLAPCPGSGAIDRAALVGLREIQRFILQEAWKGTVGIVCYEEATFQTFKAQKECMLASFGAVDWRV